MTEGKNTASQRRKEAGGPQKKPRGFGLLSPARLRVVTSTGGKASQASGRAHRFDVEEARQGGRLGGRTTAEKPGHMADIGRRGGEARAAAFIDRCIHTGRPLVSCYLVLWRDAVRVVAKELCRQPPKADDRPGLLPEVIAFLRGGKWSNVAHRARHKLVPAIYEAVPWIGTGASGQGRR